MLRLKARSKITQGLGSLFIPILFLFDPSPAFSEEELQNVLNPDDELEEELKYLKAETYVITPSRIPQRIEKAPGAIYVVTDRQIRQMGLRNIADVVGTVPGWFSRPTYWGSPLFAVRGTMGPSNGAVLFMVNGLIVNDPWNGSAWFVSHWWELDNVKRIEFVNGGLSSLYGANAYAGVINIITKEAEDINGLQLTARGGSYDTWEANALFGKKFEKLEVAAYLDYYSTDGFKGPLESDMQTVSDNRYGTHASLAPGNMRGDREQWHAQLTTKYQGLKFDGTFARYEREGPLGMTNPILDRMSTEWFENYLLNLSYEFSPADGLELLTKVYYNYYRGQWDNQHLPKGAFVYTPGVSPGSTILSEALVDFYVEWEFRRTGLEVQSTYEMTDSNNLIVGVAYEEAKIYPSKRESNYENVGAGYILFPSVQDAPDSMNLSREKRDFKAIYAEDIWDITEDLRLTIGGRYDYYSDFGGEFSPRAGLNWGFAKDYYLKLLYSHSFRAPNLGEIYHRRWGNPDLEPETSDNYSLTLSGKVLRSLSADITFFYFEGENIISVQPTGDVGSAKIYRYMNAGTVRGRGLELEMKYDFGRGTYLGMNYTYTNMEQHDPDARNWGVPEQLGTLMANVRLTRHLNFNSYLLYRGGWTREKGDSRDNPPDYAIVNATLIARNFGGWFKGLELRGSVYNIFDKDYVSPSSPAQLPDDFPMQGRSFLVGARYMF